MKRRLIALLMSLLMLAGTTLTGITAFAEDSNTADYTVEYYYGGKLDSGKTETASAEIGTIITDYTDKASDGWAFDKAEGLPLTVRGNAKENVIRVYYSAIHADTSELEDATGNGDASAEEDENLSALAPADEASGDSGSVSPAVPAQNAEDTAEADENLSALTPANEASGDSGSGSSAVPTQDAEDTAEENASEIQEESKDKELIPDSALRLNARKNLMMLGSDPTKPADISGTFSCEVGGTVSILSVLDNVADVNDRSILYLRVHSADGSGVVPVVNKNNNEYTYSVGNLSVVAKCGKNDTQKLFTGFDCTPSQAGELSVYIELVKEGNTIATGTVTLNVPYRVHDDDSLKAAPGGDVDVLGNDFITPKAKIVLCDENGADLPAKTAADGSTYYEPAPGLKLSNDGKNIVVLDDSQNGNYTFWYYAKESGKNGQSFYTDDNKTPAKVELRVSAASQYSAQDDSIVTFVKVPASVKLYANDTLPDVDLANNKIEFYRDTNRYGFTQKITVREDAGIIDDWGTSFTFNKSTGLFEYHTNSVGYSGGETYMGYRVYITDDDYVEAVIKIVYYGLEDGGGWIDYVRDFTSKPLPFGRQSVVDILNRYDALPPSDYTLSLCNEDGSAFTPPQGVTAELNDQNQLVITPDEPGMIIEPYLKLEWNGNTQIIKMRLKSDYMAMPDEANAPLGTEIPPVNVLKNDILPAIADVPGAVSRKVIITKSRWQSYAPIDPDPDGYCYPDRETDPNTGATEWSIRVKIDDDGNALATIYRQKKSDFTYAVQYLDAAGAVLKEYQSECTIYPVLNYKSHEIKTVPEFSPADVPGYEGDPDSPNKWQVVKGDYYGDDYSVSADDGVVIEKNVAATGTENLFDIILDIKTPLSWGEFLELGTCRLQNGNSDTSANRVLLYSTLDEAKAVMQFYIDTGSPDVKICTVQVGFFHDDWQNQDNFIHYATKYVVKPSGGNFYLYYEDPTPDHNLHSEKDQSRKIEDGNFYYVDITALYENYSFSLNTVVPDTVTDPMGDKILFKDFIYNPANSASYADGTVTWNVGALYNGAFEDLIKVTVDGKQSYRHQYNLIYSVTLDTAAQGFVSMTPYDTNKKTTFTYEEDGTGKDLDFKIPQVQGRVYGDLTVRKTISGNAAESTKAFSFTVTLGDKTVSGTYGGMTFTNGVAAFTLKGGESKTASGLPAGTGYTVAEADYSADGYVTTKTGDTGTITAGQPATAAFTNTKNVTPPTPKNGNLEIRKNVTGNLGDRSKYFSFKVEFDAAGTFAYNGSHSGTIASGGILQLKHGESVTIMDIPAGTHYSVTESGNSGYSVYASGDSGTILKDKTLVAKFTNCRSNVPKTGDDDNMPLWFSLMGISALGMTGTQILGGRRRRKGAHLKSR